jgi:hypothetical protein
MSDRQPTNTHAGDYAVERMIRRMTDSLAKDMQAQIGILERRVAELEKAKGGHPLWQDYPAPADAISATMRLPTVPDVYGR